MAASWALARMVFSTSPWATGEAAAIRWVTAKIPRRSSAKFFVLTSIPSPADALTTFLPTFANSGGAPEVFAYGLRNPWRFPFDTTTGTLFAGDVGQDSFEEVDIVQKGLNCGWNVMEGDAPLQPLQRLQYGGPNAPINDYGRDQGATVSGGFVYRAASISALAGTYVFGDFISGRIWGLRQNSSGAWERTQVEATGKKHLFLRSRRKQ